MYFAANWKNRESGVKFWKKRGPVILPPLFPSEASLG
jgi:hypothetical protein